jgi:hypothetical protein
MNTHDKLLLRIANTLLVNAQFLPVAGLFDGQLGVALFFYRYARYSGKKFYSDYSDEVIDAVVASVNANTPKDFGSGLTGTGWAINYLMRNGFVEPDESVFEDIDNAIEKTTLEEVVAEFRSEIPLFSMGLYSLARGRREMISDCVHLCEGLLGIKDGRIPPCFLNSMLHFLSGAHEMGIERPICENLLLTTVSLTETTLENSHEEEGYIFVFGQHVKRISKLIPNLKIETPVETNHETMIRACWSETIYGFSFAAGITTDSMEDFIDRVMLNLEEKDLAFFGGLTALGLRLMQLSYVK